MECGTNLDIDPFLLRKSAKFIHEDAFSHDGLWATPSDSPRVNECLEVAKGGGTKERRWITDDVGGPQN